jgi:hypothetical protein
VIKEEIGKYLKKELSDQFGKMAEDGLNIKTDHIKTSMKKTLVTLMFGGLGLFFILFGFAKYLATLVGISEGATFFIIGLTMIVVAMIYRAGGKN